MIASPLFDTRLHVEAPSLTVDASQHGDDLTAAGAAAYELASARTAITGEHGRALELLVEHAAGDSGVLLDHGSAQSSQVYQIEIDDGEVIISAAGVEIGRLGIPLVEALPLELLIHWATEANPASTGAGDALRSELLLYDFGNENFAARTFVHPVATADAGGTLTIGGVWSGVLTKAWMGRITAARLGVTFGTVVRAREHWVALSSAPAATDDVVRVEPREPPGGITEHEWLAGPLVAAAAVASREASHRLVSPVISLQLGMNPTLLGNLAAVFPAHWLDVEDGWQRCLAWLWRRRVPLHCTHLRGTVQLAMWADTKDEEPPGAIELRVVASNRRPGWEPLDAELIVESVVLEREVDDGEAKLGDMLELPPLPVPRDDHGYTWLWLEFRVADDITRWSLRSLCWWPTTLETLDFSP